MIKYCRLEKRWNILYGGQNSFYNVIRICDEYRLVDSRELLLVYVALQGRGCIQLGQT